MKITVAGSRLDQPSTPAKLAAMLTKTAAPTVLITADLWRIALLGALGLGPPACGSGETDAPVDSLAGGGASNQLTACGESTPSENGGGLAVCDSGLVHRQLVEACEDRRDESEFEVSDEAVMDESRIECRSHADCTGAPYGHCVPVGIPSIVGYICRYGCVSDSDCGDGSVCICGSAIGTCSSKGDCITDADCSNDARCARRTDISSCGGPSTFWCQTPQDTCATSADCESSDYCGYEQDRWLCLARPPVCGRPFLVQGNERLAPLATGSGWPTNDLAPCPRDLDASQRQRLAQHWSHIGRMEHASVAAFARFTLQLLQFGAPQDLVEGSLSAQADETAHARLAFGLASAYAGEALGPGPLPMHGALAANSLAEMVRLAVREGCVGETLAALEAGEAKAACNDPCVRGVLERIEHDERRHAELAWRFLRWALSQDPSLSLVLETELDTLRVELTRPAPHDSSRSSAACESPLAEHGVLAPDVCHAVRRLALARVVVPCAQALLERAHASSMFQTTSERPCQSDPGSSPETTQSSV